MRPSVLVAAARRTWASGHRPSDAGPPHPERGSGNAWTLGPERTAFRLEGAAHSNMVLGFITYYKSRIIIGVPHSYCKGGEVVIFSELHIVLEDNCYDSDFQSWVVGQTP